MGLGKDDGLEIKDCRRGFVKSYHFERDEALLGSGLILGIRMDVVLLIFCLYSTVLDL